VPFGFVEFLLQTFVVAIHVHFELERGLELVEFDDVVDFDVASCKVKHLDNMNVVGVEEGAVGKHFLLGFLLVTEDVFEAPEGEFAVAVEEEVVGVLVCVEGRVPWYWL
jgi:hypothetical protein